MLKRNDTALYTAQVILDYHLEKTLSTKVCSEMTRAIKQGNKLVAVITSVNGEKIVELLPVETCKQRLEESRPFSQPLEDFFNFVDKSKLLCYFFLFIELDNGFNCEYIILSQSTKIGLDHDYAIKEGK